ncbi:hypothetical protein ALC56_05937 [Trachymyrmex septentrionalis]|uniref:Uncharacterized protein n=1 Tax=Trachymyrmex septentrionalis TaxID=34720 RepID=A0A195FHG4_9HYME|nr:hypothetical protein ALC56_05937 [Trachymyrmex septentrionalis]
MNSIRTYLVITFRGSEPARTIGLRLCGTRKRSPIKVLGRYLNAALLKTGRSGERGKGDGWREEDLGLSCPKVPDESSVSSSGRSNGSSCRVNKRCECWSPRKVSRMGDIRLPIDLTLPTVSVIARLTNLFTVSQEKNHQQGLMGGRFECLLVNNVPGVLDEIDVGGSADSTGVWIWTLLPRQKRPREHPRSAMGKRASSPRSRQGIPKQRAAMLVQRWTICKSVAGRGHDVATSPSCFGLPFQSFATAATTSSILLPLRV